MPCTVLWLTKPPAPHFVTLLSYLSTVRVNLKDRKAIDPFLFSQSFLPIRKYFVIPGLVDVIHRVCGGPQAAPRGSATSAVWRGASQSYCALVGTRYGQSGSPGRRPFLPGPFTSPCPTSHSPAMFFADRNGHDPTKTAQKRPK